MPHLTYSLEQRQAIGNELLADRAHANYTGAQVRAQTGQPGATSPQPVVPATMPPLPPTAPAANGPPNAETAYVREQVRNETDDGSLATFIRKLAHGEPPATVPTVGEASGTDAAAAASPSEPAAPTPAPIAEQKPAKVKKADVPRTPGLDQFVSYLGGLLGVDVFQSKTAAASPADGHGVSPAPGAHPTPMPTPPPTPPAPGAPHPLTAPSAAASPPPATTASLEPAEDRLPLSVIAGEQPAARVRLGEGPAVPGEAAERLGAIVGQARAMDVGLRIVGHAASPAVGLDRARAVARTLVGLGAPADRLDIEAGGPGEETLVYLAPRRAS